jgi:hypothetical protein
VGADNGAGVLECSGGAWEFAAIVVELVGLQIEWEMGFHITGGQACAGWLLNA